MGDEAGSLLASVTRLHDGLVLLNTTLNVAGVAGDEPESRGALELVVLADAGALRDRLRSDWDALVAVGGEVVVAAKERRVSKGAEETIHSHSPLVVLVRARAVLLDSDGVLELLVDDTVGVWLASHEPLLCGEQISDKSDWREQQPTL